MFCSLTLRVSKTFRAHCKELLVLPGFGWRSEEKPKSIFGGAGRFGLDRGDSGWSEQQQSEPANSWKEGWREREQPKEIKKIRRIQNLLKFFIFFYPFGLLQHFPDVFFPPSSSFTSSFPSLHLTFIPFLICSHIPSMAQFVISGISASLPSCPPPAWLSLITIFTHKDEGGEIRFSGKS